MVSVLNAFLFWFVAESDSNLLTSLTSFVYMASSGSCSFQVFHLFLGARLNTFSKKSGGVRSVAVGCVIAKCAVSYSISKLVSYFRPHMLDVGISGGCEAAVHATRQFFYQILMNIQIVIKLDSIRLMLLIVFIS